MSCLFTRAAITYFSLFLGTCLVLFPLYRCLTQHNYYICICDIFNTNKIKSDASEESISENFKQKYFSPDKEFMILGQLLIIVFYGFVICFSQHEISNEICGHYTSNFKSNRLLTILSLYLRNQLLVPENQATVVYHVFIMLCYLGPLIGAILADGFLGRYRTILYFSMVYLAGNIVMCMAATPPLMFPPLISTIIGLFLIAVGTGGIKPCVAAFGGDQFILPAEAHRLQGFFSMFYFAINTGGLAGMLATPALRESITCFDEDTCYALGFGFPAVLMLIALVVFYLGRHWYRMKKPKQNVLLNFFECTTLAIKNKYKLKKEDRNKKHWLDYAENHFEKKLIKDMKIMYSIILLYVPLPLFWSLFDQQGSRWTFQASRTNGSLVIFGHFFQIVADQMQVVNPAIVLMLIPLFERFLYPKCGLLKSPLHRMVAGGVAAGAAFLASGFLELRLQETYPRLPNVNHASLNVINTLDCEAKVMISSSASQESEKDLLSSGNMIVFMNISAPAKLNETHFYCQVEIPQSCGELTIPKEKNLYTINYKINSEQVRTLLIGMKDEQSLFLYVTEPVDFTKSLSGKPRIRIAYMHGANDIKNVTVTLKTENTFDIQDVYFVADAPEDFFSLSPYMELTAGRYIYEVRSTFDFIYSKGIISLELGGVYTLVIREYQGAVAFSGMYTMTAPNTIHMLWLLPQYFLISVGEIMFAISGLEFSFTQAPKSMKTIIIAAWYLTVASGNLLVILITQARLFKKQSEEFFLFAILIFADMAIFWWMSRHYSTVPLESDGISSVVHGPKSPKSILKPPKDNESEPLLTPSKLFKDDTTSSTTTTFEEDDYDDSNYEIKKTSSVIATN